MSRNKKYVLHEINNDVKLTMLSLTYIENTYEKPDENIFYIG